MKRFDLSEMMKTAHRTYKYVGKKKGKTFGEVLKMTWKLAKMHVQAKETKAKIEAQNKRENEEMAAIRANMKVKNYKWAEGVTPEAVYPMNNIGAMGAHFVGD